MYKSERVLVKKRFMNLSELPGIMTKVRDGFCPSPFGVIRVEIRDNVAMVTLVNWSVGNEELPGKLKLQAIAINSFIAQAISQKDYAVRVTTSFDCNWKYFVYTSTDDNLYGVLKTEDSWYDLIDMSTGKKIADSFTMPYDAIDWLGYSH